jgi:DNA repair exonuclease SbcCD nuclease subunit
MKIYHSADYHFGEKNHDEAEKCLQFMVDHARNERPDAFICSGDVTDSQYLGLDTKSARTISRLFREMSDIAPVAVVKGTPSHDGNTPEILRHVAGRYPIHVSTEPEQIYLVGTGEWITKPAPFDIVLLTVTQVPAPTKEYWQNRQGVEQDNENISQAMASIFAGFGAMAEKHNAPHILNGHFSLVGSKISEHQTMPGSEISISRDSLAMARANLCCLGHIHMAQEYQYQGGMAYHCGSLYRKDFGERSEQKGFYIHERLGGAWDSRFIKTPTRTLKQIDIDLIKNPDLFTGLNEWVLDQVEPDSWVKVVIDIWIDEIRLINQAALKRSIEEKGARVTMEINRVRRENTREDAVLRAESLVDKVKALAEHRSKPVPDGSFDMLEKIEALNAADLAKYARERLEQVEKKEERAA